MSSSIRQLAVQLSLSVATVSRALRLDPCVRPETAQRVQDAAREAGYHPDPVVSEGFARARRQVFYRETIAWCSDRPHDQMPWLAPFFQSLENHGRLMGYDISYFHFGQEDEQSLRRLANVWKARGIRGIVLGPFNRAVRDLPFPWEQFVWIAVGYTLVSPALHRVGRDFHADFRRALAWLHERGCRRTGFIQDPGQTHIFKRFVVQAALAHNYQSEERLKDPILEMNLENTASFTSWSKRNRPDSLIMVGAPDQSFLETIGDMTIVSLAEGFSGSRFETNFEIIGQSSVNFMHRLLVNRDVGIPRYEQSVMIASKWNFPEMQGRPSDRLA